MTQTRPAAERDIRGGLMVALGFIASAGSLSTDMYLPAFPDISESFTAGASAVQFTLTAFLIGSALGQLVIGALSDALGRRRTLVAALILFALCSWAAALSPGLGFLIAVRGLQGFAGSAGAVLGRAIVADLAPKSRAARAFGLLWGIIALSPAIANPIAAALTSVGGWRLALAALATIATLMTVVAVLVVPESLPPARRHPLDVRGLARNVGRLVAKPVYLCYVLAYACAYGTLIAYLGTSSFIVQGLLGLPPLGYSVTYTITALTIMLGSWGAGRISHRIAPVRLLQLAQGALVLPASLVLLILALTGTLTLWSYLPLAMVFALGAGTIMSTGSALALGHAGSTAGAGSAFLGLAQFTIGAIASPLGGILGPENAIPAFLTMTGFIVLGLGFALVAHAAERRTGDETEPVIDHVPPEAAV